MMTTLHLLTSAVKLSHMLTKKLRYGNMIDNLGFELTICRRDLRFDLRCESVI